MDASSKVRIQNQNVTTKKRLAQSQKRAISAANSSLLRELINSLGFQMRYDKMVWCELRNIPCIHPEPDGLENCRYCEKYSFEKYLEYKKSKRKVKRAKREPD